MSGAGQKIRAFVAVFPSVEVRNTVIEMQQRWRTALSRSVVRWSAPEQIHVTTQFLGSIDVAQTGEYLDAIESVCSETVPFVLHVAGTGCFPSLKNPRVIWAGLAGEIKPMQILQRNLDHALGRVGYAPETRPFHPHLTIGRVGQLNAAERQRVGELAESLKGIKSGEWRVERVELMQSTLLPSGAKYTVVKSFRLRT